MDLPYGSVTPSSTHLGSFASNLSSGQIYAPGTALGGAPTTANFNRQHFSPLNLLPPCSSASNGELLMKLKWYTWQFMSVYLALYLVVMPRDSTIILGSLD